MNRLLAFALFCGGAALFGQTAPTPAERRIQAARAAIAKNPGLHTGFNDLAMALARRARETADSSFYDQAGEAVGKSLELAPDNFEALKVRAWVLLGRHEFAQALELAETLNKRAPDDLQVYGFLADAHAELGDYQQAEKAVQWMLDIRPGNIPGLTRGAYLRELFGDLDGAVEFMSEAYTRTPHGEVEDRAWILTHIAHLQLSAGKTELAGRVVEEALRLFPGYHYALAELAKVRTAQGRHEEAAELFRQRYGSAPHPENLYDVAVALQRAGKQDEAAECFREFERLARREMNGVDNANRELIFYYVEHAGKVEEALRIARQEIGRRRDVNTLDAYAWALHAAGENEEARRQMEKALAVGTKDPKILEHARRIL